MQNPTTSDPSFKKFLEDLQKDNNRSFVTQLLQLKADREVAGEDDEKQKEQLDDINKSLGDIKSVITGTDLHFNVQPLVQVGENNAELLQKSLEELALIRKLTEGSVEFDKKLAGYRNTSGREVQNKVSGKMAKVGGVIDFETARDFTSGQGKRAQEANAINLKTIDYVPGKSVSRAVKGQKADTEIDTEANDKLKEKTQFQGFGKEIVSGLKFFMTDGLSEKEGYGLFQKPPKDVVKKERESEVTGGVGADKPVTQSTEVVDIKSNKEIGIKQDIKEVVKKERETKVTGGKGAVNPASANSDSDNTVSAPEAIAKGTKEDLEVSRQLLDTTRDQLTVLKEIKDALLPKTPAELQPEKIPPSPGSVEAKSEGSSLLGDVASAAGDLLGGRKNPGSKAPSKIGGMISKATTFAGSKLGGGILGGIGGAISSGISAVSDYSDTKEALAKGEITQEEATVRKGSAVGKGIGGTIGGVLGGVAGSFLGPVGTVAGAALGNVAGEYVGEKVGSIGGKISNFFNTEKPSATPKGNVAGYPATQSSQKTIIADEEFTPGKPLSEKQMVVIGMSKSMGNNYPPEIETQYSKQKNNVAAAPATPKETVAGKKVDSTKDYLAPAGTLSTDPQMDKDIREHRKQVGEIKSKKPDQNYLDAAPAIKSDVKPDNYLAPAATTPVGAEVARTSTENADMSREAGKSGGNNTIVSNNVSSNNTTKFVPMKPSPRPQSQGSALDRYQDRVTVY